MPASCDWIGLKSRKSAWWISWIFGPFSRTLLRPTTSTDSTRESSRHSRRTPSPTMPVAPKMTTFMPCGTVSQGVELLLLGVARVVRRVDVLELDRTLSVEHDGRRPLRVGEVDRI